MEYEAFLDSKRIVDQPTGLKEVPDLNPMLFDFQRDIVRWALRRGRAAIFADCGLGKTPMQLEWARHVPGDVLILAPLAVSRQTIREGEKFHISVTPCRKQEDAKPGINITNYEMLDHFDPSKFTGIVLDESSILKAYTGKFRTQIIESFAKTPFKLACTATPAPNDYMELANHAEFLGSMRRSEMLSMFFVHDGGETQKWRLKGHAQSDFWKWLCSWSVMLRRPSDLGYADDNFVLPELTYHYQRVDTEATGDFLFPLPAETLQERRSAKRSTIEDRVKMASTIANADDGQWLIWCNLNDESAALTAAIRDAVEVKGADPNEHKETAMMDFAAGKLRVLVSKPSIAGFGMNFQSCHNMAFVGLSDSYEQLYQATRRCWRFGQKHPVNCHIITADIEGNIVENIKRKERDAERMAINMVQNMSELNKANIAGTERVVSTYRRDAKTGKGWRVELGDCVEVARELASDSIHFSMFSPPFSSLYTYSNSDRDMGNCTDDGQFMIHFKFLIAELFRVTMPGRLCSFHCMNLPTSKTHHGYIGIRDFRGELIAAFEKEGFIFHSEVCVWKDPVTAMQRTKALGLLHKQLKKDSCMSRQGIPDYVVTMRKPGDNPERVTHTNATFPVQLWQNYASPIWMDINPSDTLQFRQARENNDERHICPLQLEVIRRCIKLWTNPGDTVLSPFAGIGSEGWVAIEQGREYIGIELKESYWKTACSNLLSAVEKVEQESLFGA